MTIISNGLFVTGGMTVYGGAYFQTPGPVTFSDRRLKTRIEQLERPLSKVSQLRGVYFSWVSDEESGLTLDERRHVGLIAQDVQAVLPEVVHEMSEVTPGRASYLGVNYAEMVPLLLEAIRELDERTSSLRARPSSASSSPRTSLASELPLSSSPGHVEAKKSSVEVPEDQSSCGHLLAVIEGLKRRVEATEVSARLIRTNMESLSISIPNLGVK